MVDLKEENDKSEIDIDQEDIGVIKHESPSKHNSFKKSIVSIDQHPLSRH